MLQSVGLQRVRPVTEKWNSGCSVDGVRLGEGKSQQL